MSSFLPRPLRKVCFLLLLLLSALAASAQAQTPIFPVPVVSPIPFYMQVPP